MKKIKIVVILIATMLLGLSAISISRAVDLEASIDVTLKDWGGYVSPSVNVSTDEKKNQTIELKVKVNETGNPENYKYIVNDTLVINLNIDDQTGRKLGFFFIPRFVVYRIVLKKDPEDLFEPSIIKPASGAKNVVENVFSLLGIWPIADKIEVAMSYNINNETFDQDNGIENLSLVISTMGFPPANVNGHGLLDGENPIIDRQIVNLEIHYKDETTL